MADSGPSIGNIVLTALFLDRFGNENAEALAADMGITIEQLGAVLQAFRQYQRDTVMDTLLEFADYDSPEPPWAAVLDRRSTKH